MTQNLDIQIILAALSRCRSKLVCQLAFILATTLPTSQSAVMLLFAMLVGFGGWLVGFHVLEPLCCIFELTCLKPCVVWVLEFRFSLGPALFSTPVPPYPLIGSALLATKCCPCSSVGLLWLVGTSSLCNQAISYIGIHI